MLIEPDKLESKNPKVKYGYAKKLLRVGADSPGLLYGHFDLWEKMLHSNNNILKWTAIDILGYLSVVDKQNKTEKIIKELLKLLHGGQLITCNHAIFALGIIAMNKPKLREQIIKELLAISKDTFETAECQEIAAGKVILTLAGFADQIRNNKAAMGFIKKAKFSKRNATRKKAETVLKKIGAGSIPDVKQ